MSATAASKRRFVALDSWRGLCAVLVAVHNFDYPGTVFVNHLALLVDFFFVLSGFVITHSCAGRMRDGAAFISFVVGRIGRLWPLHMVMLLAFVGLDVVKLMHGHGSVAFEVAPFTAPNSVSAIVQNVFLVQTIGVHTELSWNVPSWSISTEFWTYVLFGCICLVRPGRIPSVWLMAAIAALAAAGVLAFSPGFLVTNTNVAVLRCIYGFFAGHIVYRIWASGTGEARSGAMLEIAATVAGLGFVWACEGAWSMAAPIVFGFAVWVFAHESGPVSRVLKMRGFVWLGTLSYAVYMVSWLFRNLFSRLVRTSDFLPAISTDGGTPWHGLGHSWRMDAVLAAYVVAIVVAGAIVHLVIERPGQQAFRRH